jgi:hypothetical protein
MRAPWYIDKRIMKFIMELSWFVTWRRVSLRGRKPLIIRIKNSFRTFGESTRLLHAPRTKLYMHTCMAGLSVTNLQQQARSIQVTDHIRGKTSPDSRVPLGRSWKEVPVFFLQLNGQRTGACRHCWAASHRRQVASYIHVSLSTPYSDSTEPLRDSPIQVYAWASWPAFSLIKISENVRGWDAGTTRRQICSALWPIRMWELGFCNFAIDVGGSQWLWVFMRVT